MTTREKVLKLRKDGKTIQQITEAMGFKTTSAVTYYLNRAKYRRLWLTEAQIILLESILIQIKPTSEFTAEALYEIGDALKVARTKQ